MSASLPTEDDAFEEIGAPPPPAGHPPARRASPAGRRGHGTRWIVTYSDMITLLIAFFIALIAFSTKGVGRDAPKGPSLLAGPGGKGVAGPGRGEHLPRDAAVWRPRFDRGPQAEAGAEFAPLYYDPEFDTAEGVLRALASAPPGKVGDPYALRLPLGTLFGSKSTLTPSGTYLLRTVAANLRNMPYDFHLRVPSPLHIPRAVRVATFLSTSGGIHPGRIAVGVRPEDGEGPDAVVLEFTPQT